MTSELWSPRRRLAVLAVVAAFSILASGCANGGDDDSGGGAADAAQESVDEAEADMAAPEPAAGERAADEAGSDFIALGNKGAEVAQQAVISTATVSLRSEDVGDAVFDVQKIVDKYAGSVADEKTDGGDDARRSRLVLRVPSDDFDAALADLMEVGDLESTSRRSEDVTTQVIDNEVRIRAQERSLRRIELLLDRAATIRDIFAIERELSERQAALDSLKAQQAYLADQTSLATITVHIERAGAPDDEPDTDDAGFLSGLEDGWNALRTFGGGVATVLGAVLPFALVLGVLGVPTWLVVRRLLRRRPPRAAPSPGA